MRVKSSSLCLLWLSLITVFLLPLKGLADEYSPAYLKMEEVQEDIFDVLWKVPVLEQGLIRIKVDFSEAAKITIPPRSAIMSNAFIERSTVRFINGLAGEKITIDKLEQVNTEVLVRIEYLNGATETARLTASTPDFVVQGSPTTFDTINTYLVFGVEHILQGMDHLLFVACLIFIAGTWRRILVTITGFTLAHSVTLTLAALNVISLPIPPIEAVIALSIVFLAREISLSKRDTLTWRHPIAVSSTFGLLHGFGFASALSELGLPQTEIPAALLAFNVGVEIGQILFVLSAIILSWCVIRLIKLFITPPKNIISTFEKVAAYSIGGITTFWTIERVSSFWG